MAGTVPANRNFVTPLAAGATLNVSGLGTVQVVPREPAAIDQSAQIVTSPFTTVGPFNKNVDVFMQAFSQPLEFLSMQKPSAIRWTELELSTNKDDAQLNIDIIQSALDSGGYVAVLKPGIYPMDNTTLYIGDNTFFLSSWGVTYRQKQGLKARMLACRSSLATPTPVSLAWTTNDSIVTVTWANHGLTDEDYVCLQGAQLSGVVSGATLANPCVITAVGHGMQTGDRATISGVGGTTQLNGNTYIVTRLSADTFSISNLVGTINSSAFGAFSSNGTFTSVQGEYNNVFRVFTVVDANSFTISLYETPTIAPSGSVTAVRCTRTFAVQGGTWDYDRATNQGSPTNLNLHAITLHYAADFRASDIKCTNVLKYGFNTMATADYVCERIEGSGVAEIFKHYGPIANGTVDGIYGDSIDDCTTVQMREPPAFINYQPAQGDIINLTIKNVNVRNVGGTASGAIVVYASNHDRCVNLTYDKVIAKGTVCPGIRIRNGDTFTVGQIEDLTIIDAVTSGKVTSNYSIFAADVGIKGFKLVRPKFVPADLTSPYFSTNANTNIETMQVDGMRFYNEAWPTGGVGLFVLNGVMGRFIAENCDIRGQSGLGFVSVGGGQFIANIILRDSRFEGISYVVDCRSLANIYRENCVFNNIPNGVLRIQSTAGLVARVYGSGRNTYAVATEALVVIAPATAEVYDWDLRIDPIAVTQLATTPGQYCWSTQAGAEAGPCVRVTAGWAALAAGAAFANQQIT